MSFITIGLLHCKIVVCRELVLLKIIVSEYSYGNGFCPLPVYVALLKQLPTGTLMWTHRITTLANSR